VISEFRASFIPVTASARAGALGAEGRHPVYGLPVVGDRLCRSSVSRFGRQATEVADAMHVLQLRNAIALANRSDMLSDKLREKLARIVAILNE
jgi:hypothetical protein